MPHSKIRADDTILTGAATDEVDLKNRVLVGVITPSGISSVTMKIAAAPKKGGTFVNIQDGLGQYGAIGDITFTMAASKHLTIPPTITANLTNIKLVFNASETAKTFTLVTREI